MSEKRTYEEWNDEGMNDLPLPDENASWNKMNALLDKEDEGDRVIPPMFLRSCAFAVAGFAIVALIWFFAWQKPGDHSQATNSEKPATQGAGQNGDSSTNTLTPDTKTSPGEASAEGTSSNTEKHSASNGNEQEINVNSVSTGSDLSISHSSAVSGKHEDRTRTNTKITTSQDNRGKNMKSKKAGKKSVITRITIAIDSKRKNQKVDDSNENENRSTVVDKNNMKSSDSVVTSHSEDTLARKKVNPIKATDTLAKAHTDSAAVVKINPAKKTRYLFSTGLGIQQQIAIAQQQSVPYNYYGKKNTLTDYIPSVFARLERENKWFVTAEFRYGAPQSVKAFSFSRHTTADSGLTSVDVKSLNLKKVYYHHLPISFNYYLQPKFSIGAGMIYSWFHGAIIEEEVRKTSVASSNETISRRIVQVPHFTDSFLYKTQLHYLLQAEYHRNNISVCLRYSRDLEPYIRFTKPDGAIVSQKNQSLDLILRLRLWKKAL